MKVHNKLVAEIYYIMVYFSWVLLIVYFHMVISSKYCSYFMKMSIYFNLNWVQRNYI